MITSANMIGEAGRPNAAPVFCYAIRLLDAEEAFFLTSYPEIIEISDLPASWDADEIQEFLPAQIGHGQVERVDGIDKITFDVQVRLAEVQGLSRYTLFAAIPRIQIDVMRVSHGPLMAGDPAIYGRDTVTVQSGLISDFSTEGFLMKARCAPEPFLTGHQVPRWRFTRTCNRTLYAPDCGVNREDFSLDANIVSLNHKNRTMILSDVRPGPDDFFRQGVLIHQATGSRHSIFKSEVIGATTKIWIQQWFPDFEVGDVVTAAAGCRHTLASCTAKFDNAENFGGFPFVPNVNPSMHGIQ